MSSTARLLSLAQGWLTTYQTILHYMVSSGTATRPSQGVLFLLQRSGLMASIQ